MARVSLTICGICALAGLSAAGMQSPQIRTGAATGAQPAGTPAYRTQIVPRSPSGAVKKTPTVNRNTVPQKPPAATVRPQPMAAAPKKEPQVAGAPTASNLPPMGPPYPAPEIPKPARPADMPPVPPQVSYRDGMLTVNAMNSTMSSVLSAIRAKTGIEFDGAEGSAERVAVNLGPAPEGEVLAGIFSGSSFDYVVLGRADSPGTVQRVILTAKGRGAPAVAGGMQPVQQPPQVQQESDEEVTDDAAEQEPQDAPVQPPPVQEPPAVPNQQTQNNEQPKTPEQLLQELKQMQLQQQQQQGQPPPDPNSVPRKVPPRP